MSRFQGTSLIKAALKCLVVPTVGGPDDFTLPLSLPSLPLRAPACSWAAAASPLPSLLCSGHLSRSMGSEAHLWRVLREKGLGGGSVGGHPALTPHPALLTCNGGGHRRDKASIFMLPLLPVPPRRCVVYTGPWPRPGHPQTHLSSWLFIREPNYPFLSLCCLHGMTSEFLLLIQVDSRFPVSFPCRYIMYQLQHAL